MSVTGKRTVSLRELLRGAATSVLVRGSELTPVSPADLTKRVNDTDTPLHKKRSSFFDDDIEDSEPSLPIPDPLSSNITSPCPVLPPRPARAGLSRLSPFLTDDEDYLFESKERPDSPPETSSEHKYDDDEENHRPAAGRRSAPRLPTSTQLVSAMEHTKNDPLELDSGNRPGSQQSRNRPVEALPLPGSNGIADSAVNCHLATCLLDHQVAGVRWLWGKYCLAQGCILGDDMGLGKTVQIIALLSGILRKSGTTADVEAIRLRRRGKDHVLNLTKPSLIVCPASVIDNWKQELDKWGFFLYQSIESTDVRETIARALVRRLEVIICSYDKMKIYCGELAEVEWEVVVFDEGHCLKNEKMARYQAAMR